MKLFEIDYGAFFSGAWYALLGMVPPDWWFWIWIGLYAVPVIVVLWLLTIVKQWAGWPGVAASLLALGYAFGFLRNKTGGRFNPFDNPPPAPPKKRK